MNTPVDWNQTMRNSLRTAKRGVAKFLTVAGKVIVWIGVFIHEFGKKLGPHAQPPK